MHPRSVFILAFITPFVLLQPDPVLAQPFCDVTELTRFDGGSSFDIDDDIIVVGKHSKTNGRATVYRRQDGGGWDTGTRVALPDETPQRSFGEAVALDGDILVIAAPWATGAAPSSGAVYVFRHHCGDWTQEATLLPEFAQENAGFGYSVAISGDTIMVGAVHETGISNQSGAAYVFRLSGSTWTQEARLSPDDLPAGAEFGISVAISGDVAVVGARHVNSAYIFRRTDGTWTQEAKFTEGDGFGFCVAASGEACLIGSTWGHVARAYRCIEGIWTLEASLQSSDADAEDWVGFSVALDGDIAVVSVLQWDDNGAVSVPRPVLVFRYANGAWHEAVWLMPTDPWPRPFGAFVAADNGTVLVHADSDFDGHWDIAAYVYRGLGDCNGNGEPDTCDIAAGTSLDANANGIPDECTAEEAFVNSSGLPAECAEEEEDTPDDDASDDTSNDLPVSRFTCGDGSCGAGLLTCCPLALMFVRRTKRRRHSCIPIVLAAALWLPCSTSAWAQPVCEVTESARVPGGGGLSFDNDTVVMRAQTSSGDPCVTVYRLEGSTLTEQAQLLPDDPAVETDFGHAIAIDNDVIVVGSPMGDESAYVFRKVGDTWTKEARLTPRSVWEIPGEFGHDVAVSGDSIIVGEPFTSRYGSDCGAFHFFSRDGSTWSRDPWLGFPPVTWQCYGGPVAMCGDLAIVGTSCGNTFGVYRRIDGVWTEEAVIECDFEDLKDVATDGETCLVSSVFGQAVEVYRRIDGAWVKDAEIRPSDTRSIKTVGHALAMDANLVVFSNFQWNPQDGYSLRPVCIFRCQDSVWYEEAWLLPGDMLPWLFGPSLAIDRGTILVARSGSTELNMPSGLFIYRGLSDCNCNGVLDTCDLADGTSIDANANGIPDECASEDADPGTYGLSGLCDREIVEDETGDDDSSDDSSSDLPITWPNCGDGACGTGLLACCPLTLLLLHRTRRVIE